METEVELGVSIVFGGVKSPGGVEEGIGVTCRYIPVSFRSR